MDQNGHPTVAFSSVTRAAFRSSVPHRFTGRQPVTQVHLIKSSRRHMECAYDYGR